MLHFMVLECGSTFCKSAYPGSIPGVASKFPKENQAMSNKLDALGARVAPDARDKSRDASDWLELEWQKSQQPPVDIRPAGQHVICGMCNSYPASFGAHQWRCATVQDTREAKDDACERWRPREEWKPDPPMYSLLRDRQDQAERTNELAGPILPAHDAPPPSFDPQVGFVYFLECGEFVKIGFSSQPKDRKKTLGSSSPYKQRFIGLMRGTLADERRLHLEHKARRHTGEWFRLDDELRREISRLCGKGWRKLMNR